MALSFFFLLYLDDAKVLRWICQVGVRFKKFLETDAHREKQSSLYKTYMFFVENFEIDKTSLFVKRMTKLIDRNSEINIGIAKKKMKDSIEDARFAIGAK